jgi:hypothetical protein
MLVGYARTSSLAQVAGLEAQERELRAAGCDKIFAEQVSSVAQREQLALALDYVREGPSMTLLHASCVCLPDCWRATGSRQVVRHAFPRNNENPLRKPAVIWALILG